MFELYWRKDVSHEWILEMRSRFIHPILEYTQVCPLAGQYKGIFEPTGQIFFYLDIALTGM